MRIARVLSLFLALILVVALLPVTASAATECTVTFYNKTNQTDGFVEYAVQTVPRKGHPTPPDDPPSYTDGAYRYAFKEWYWYFDTNTIATFSFTSDQCKIWSDTKVYASYTQYLAEGWRMVITRGGTTVFVTDTNTPVAQILKQYSGYSSISVEQYNSGSGGEHSHSFDYINPNWQWATVEGKLAAEVSYACACGETETETISPSYTESRGERTYLAADSHGNSDTKTVTLSYTVTLNGVTVGEQYQWGDVCALSAGGRKAWYLNSAEEANKVADGVNSYSFAVINDTNILTGDTSSDTQQPVVAVIMTTPASGKANIEAMWSVPENARVRSVTIYRGYTSAYKDLAAQTLIDKGTQEQVPLTVTNGSYLLRLSDLTPTRWQHAVIVINYTQDGEARTLVSAVQKILPNGNG